MPSKIATAIKNEAVPELAKAVQQASSMHGPVGDHAATEIARGAVDRAVNSYAVEQAVRNVLPQPIDAIWSTSLQGATVAALGAAWTLYDLWSADTLTATNGVPLGGVIIGAIFAFYGRWTTTRPIAGTEAAAKVERAAQ